MASYTTSLYNATVIVTSDTCYKKPDEDISGQYVVEQLKSLNFAIVTKVVVPDEKDEISRSVRTALEEGDNALIVTVGGTGFCPRDVTPEATSLFYEKQCNGIVTALHMTSLRYSPHAAISRLTAGINGQCLIINFPGKPKACKECFACLEGFLSHALEQIRFDAVAIKFTHSKQDTILGKDEVLPKVVSSSDNLQETNLCEILSSDLKLSKSIEGKAQLPSESTQSISDTSESAPISEVSGSISDPASQDSSIVNASSEKSNSFRPANIKTESSWPLIEYDRALDILCSLSSGLLKEKRSFKLDSLEASHKLLGKVLAKSIYAKSLNPPFPVSTMDGYVLNVPSSMRRIIPAIGIISAKLVDCKDTFDVMQTDPVFSSNFFCYQVNTGGRVPEKDFAVVPFEKTSSSLADNLVRIFEVKLDKFVRSPGSDLNHSDCLEDGTKIGPVELSLILSMGHKQVEIFEKPVIGVLSTGDELVEPYTQAEISTNFVYDSNLPLLTSLFMTNGHQVISYGIAKDHPLDLSSKISSSLQNCDILLITGGASMGTKDFVKSVIVELGGVIHFGRVNIKPGKPVAFASRIHDNRKKFIFSLPGNPVSAYITASVLVLPFIDRGMKNSQTSDTTLSKESLGIFITVEVRSIIDYEGDNTYLFENRLEFVRAKFVDKDQKQVEVSIRQQSSRLMSLKGYDCLLMVEPSMSGSKLMIGQTYQAVKLHTSL